MRNRGAFPLGALLVGSVLVLALVVSFHGGTAREQELYQAVPGEYAYGAAQQQQLVQQQQGQQEALEAPFDSQYAEYQDGQGRVQEEGAQFAAQQAILNRDMGAYAQQQLAEAPQAMPGTSGTLSTPSHPGMSTGDASPVFPKKFEEELAKSRKKLVRIKRILHRTAKEEKKTEGKETGLKDMVRDEVQEVRDAVLEENKDLTNQINAGYHEVQGPRGPPGIAGPDGRNGGNGPEGTPGIRGPTGVHGQVGPRGKPGRVGRTGPRGPPAGRGLVGPSGKAGPVGGRGPGGRQGKDNAWSRNRYWCPGGGNENTRLVACNQHACRLETNLNGQWGTVCDEGFTQASATTVCRSLGFMSGGHAKRVGGGSGPIWLANVRCKGDEGDVVDCPKTCGSGNCNHGRDVGLCCWGSSYGDQGVRQLDPTKLKTVSQMRAECLTVPTCPSQSGPKAKFYRHCGSGARERSGWTAHLGEGRYPSFNGRTCDDDERMCSVPGCGIVASQLRSMVIPSGVKVTLYKGADFRGHRVTYTGPTDSECLNWEGWGDVARSIVVAKAAPRSESKWAIRIWKSTALVAVRPSLAALDFVGSGHAPFLNLRSAAYFAKYVPGAPPFNFAAEFYGVLRVRKSGMYTFCDTSDDGSRVWVDDKLFIHRRGWGSTCAKRQLREGEHEMRADMFQGGGPTNFKLKYSGPDTGGNMMFVRSERVGKAPSVAKLANPSNFQIKIYRSAKPLYMIPEILETKLVGSADQIQTINFRRGSSAGFKSAVPGTPSRDFAWVIFGAATVERPGRYLFCLTSNDGSRLFVNDWIVVNNDGRHGDYTRCAWRYLAKGEHQVVVEGFSHSGGGMCALRYKGPDTGNSLLYLKARGSGAKAPQQVKSSSWNMQMYHSNRQLNRMPNLRFLKMVGKKVVKVIDLRNHKDFKAAVPQTPGSNYAWAFYGSVEVSKAGTYSVCATSDDGSYVFVDKGMLVNNDGLHGPRKVCGSVRLSEGKHKVMADGFQRYGGAYMRLTWNGPDTGGVERLMPSEGEWKPKKEVSSSWTMRMFKAPVGVSLWVVPNLRQMDYVGQAKVPAIDFANHAQMNQAVPGTPGSNYVWAFWGKVTIRNQGLYKWCTTSDDGSKLWVDGSLVVNNDGLHGAHQRCRTRMMPKGAHVVKTVGFQRGGGVFMQAHYSGPDTGNRRELIPSDDANVAPAAPNGKVGWKVRVYSIPSSGPWRGRVSNFAKTGHLKGSAVVKIVRFYSHSVLHHYVPGTPGSWYGWVLNGVVRIQRAGRYTWCTTSDDGSKIWVNKHYIVNNDGFHGNRERCGSIYLKKGNANVLLMGWQGQGGIGEELTYSGPDTSYQKRWPVSESSVTPSWVPPL